MIAGLVSTLALVAAPLVPAQPLTWQEVPIVATGAGIRSIDSRSGSLWAVGSRRESAKDWDRPVAARWAGGRWEPTTQLYPLGELSDVAVRAPDDVWAVGSRLVSKDPPDGVPLVQHWDGKTWHEIPFPHHDNAYLASVAVHGDAVWVLGSERKGELATNFAERYNGKRWIPLTDSVLGTAGHPWEVAVIAPDNVWAADSMGIKHYDGSRWSKAKLPGPDGALINDLAVAGPDDIWAIGHREDPLRWRTPVAYHYDGKRWSQVRTPLETGQTLAIELVDGIPVAVGETRQGAYVLRWTREGFVSEPPPPEPYGLSATAIHNGRLWTVGFQPGKLEGVNDPYIAYAGR